VKFPNNPQGIRILANDFIGSQLASFLGLAVAIPAIVRVKQILIDLSKEMVIERERYSERCRGGLCFGSRFSSGPARAPTAFTDYISPEGWTNVENREDFLGMFVFDVWTHNMDTRQFVFLESSFDGKTKALMIDQGNCFNGAEWSFADTSGHGVHFRRDLFGNVRSIDGFDLWLDKLENKMTLDVIERIAAQVPAEWYDNQTAQLSELVSTLEERRMMTRKLLIATWNKNRDCFANWNRKVYFGGGQC
jgi:hypothetical protein